MIAAIDLDGNGIEQPLKLGVVQVLERSREVAWERDPRGRPMSAVLQGADKSNAQNFLDVLLNRQLVIVKLDVCTGLLGGSQSTIKCGQDYVIQYPGAPGTTPKGNMCEKVCGWNAQKNFQQVCGGYCNSNPQTTHSIDLFGRVLFYNDAGEVRDRDEPHPLIGHLEIAPPQPPAPTYLGICSCHVPHSEIYSGCNENVSVSGPPELAVAPG